MTMIRIPRQPWAIRAHERMLIHLTLAGAEPLSAYQVSVELGWTLAKTHQALARSLEDGDVEVVEDFPVRRFRLAEEMRELVSHAEAI